MRKFNRKLETVATVGLDLKNVSQVHDVDAAGNVVVNKPIGRGKLVAFFANCRNAWSAWRPVPRRTIGGVRSPRSAMTCA